mmetsp:Transcript_8007/g.11895  ORF Transcript_8007/g.11895 Transcript_8007/m.11895 type:complete len:167 (+) Transcript_8007:241-741(+)
MCVWSSVVGTVYCFNSSVSHTENMHMINRMLYHVVQFPSNKRCCHSCSHQVSERSFESVASHVKKSVCYSACLNHHHHSCIIVPHTHDNMTKTIIHSFFNTHPCIHVCISTQRYVYLHQQTTLGSQTCALPTTQSCRASTSPYACNDDNSSFSASRTAASLLLSSK